MSSGDDNENYVIEKHSSFWLSDGNIVLSVPSSVRKCSVLFRVHKSVLARHSTVFADMLSFGESDAPATGPDAYEGLPLVTLPQESAEDWQKLLEIFYGSS